MGQSKKEWFEPEVKRLETGPEAKKVRLKRLKIRLTAGNASILEKAWFESKVKRRITPRCLEIRIVRLLCEHPTFISTKILASFLKVSKKQVYEACLFLEEKNRIKGRRKYIRSDGQLAYHAYEDISWAYILKL
jgi:hypothetical protein